MSENLRVAFLVLGQAGSHVKSGERIIAISSSVLAKVVSQLRRVRGVEGGRRRARACLANELRGQNITVNAVTPGPVPTDLFLRGKTEAQIAELSTLAPLERLGQPEDVAT